MTPENVFDKANLSGDCVKVQENMGIPREILAAMIYTESSANPGAIRFEPNYRWLYDPERFASQLGHTLDTEIALQKFSYGLLQIMGATARQQGMHGNLFKLLTPEIGVSWGCLYLRHLFDRYGNWLDAISAYNQGDNRKYIITGQYKNQKYVDKVISRARYFGMDV